MSLSRSRRMNLVALALLVSALVAFTIFHFSRVDEVFGFASGWLREKDSIAGWQVWLSGWVSAKTWNTGGPNVAAEMLVSAMLTSSALSIIAAPFLLPILRSSLLAWWLVVFFSFCGICLGISIVSDYAIPEAAVLGGLRPGTYCLIFAQILNVVGLLFIRREPVAELP